MQGKKIMVLTDTVVKVLMKYTELTIRTLLRLQITEENIRHQIISLKMYKSWKWLCIDVIPDYVTEWKIKLKKLLELRPIIF